MHLRSEVPLRWTLSFNKIFLLLHPEAGESAKNWRKPTLPLSSPPGASPWKKATRRVTCPTLPEPHKTSRDHSLSSFHQIKRSLIKITGHRPMGQSALLFALPLKGLSIIFLIYGMDSSADAFALIRQADPILLAGRPTLAPWHLTFFL